MIQKSFVSGLFTLFLLLVLSGCGNSKYRGTPTEIQVIPDKNAHINYGYTFKLRTFLIYSSGDRKEITGKVGLEINVKDTHNNGEYVTINGYPKSFLSDSLEVSAVYTKRKFTFSKQAKIPFNYKGDINVQLSAGEGFKGEDGSNGRTALLFRHGKDGDNGTAGGPGENGHDLSVHIYKDESSQLYFIRVTDVTTSMMYYYKTKDLGYGLGFTVAGGYGGSGGDGGSGGSGKDGTQTEEKTKSPGSGGDGGSGGAGGHGGDGGTVYVFVHPSAKDFVRQISMVNIGGPGGVGGSGGAGGKAGTPLEGQTANTEGAGGNGGAGGLFGVQGSPIQISVEDFDIDY